MQVLLYLQTTYKTIMWYINLITTTTVGAIGGEGPSQGTGSGFLSNAFAVTRPLADQHSTAF